MNDCLPGDVDRVIPSLVLNFYEVIRVFVPE